MKLAPLLAQFLYNNKRLDLEGIGSFFLDPSVVIDKDPTRPASSSIPTGIRFENNAQTRESAEFIQFISEQTGKMKALASADLRSHLEMAQQFLNIGKPFFLEGIGNLVKIRSGQYEFTAGMMVNETIRENQEKETPENRGGTYKPFLEKSQPASRLQMPVLALLILLGIGLAVTGGYILNKRSGKTNGVNLSKEKKVAAPQPTESVQPAVVPPQQTQPAAHDDAGSFKYVLETASKNRALTRYNKLKEYQWDVKLETSDSIRYKIFLILPSLAMDTSRVADSLTALNGRPVYIEH